ncbi:MAG: CocE/NonD family hydrolase [Clostridiales bacterium]|nr:CocE/NonD family hydrolase [Clostridiales bacterium]
MKKEDWKYTSLIPLEQSGYPGLNECSYRLKKGTIVKNGCMPLAVDILVNQDTKVLLRDGTTIRVDVYRPDEEGQYPVIMWYAPYGKRGSTLNMDSIQHPNRMDVERSWEDGLNSFEAPNPSYWVAHGYVVISPDPRGIGSSEGNAYAWGSLQTQDECDLIEWAGAQPWSNGKVGLTGTSYLAMSQYAVAAENPKHLCAIAPWEGALNPYKEVMARGGIADSSFSKLLGATLYSNQPMEDVNAMLEEHKYYDEYWKDKTPDLSKSKVPAYFVASWTNALHSDGTIAAWSECTISEKWLRISSTHEWNDYYNPSHVEDLRKFFDYYLKDINNGWENTPKIRLTVLNPGHKDCIDRSETILEHKGEAILYLNHEGILTKEPCRDKGTAEFDFKDGEGIHFNMIITEGIEWIGYGSLKLFVELETGDDGDIYVYVRKKDKDGNVIEIENVTQRYYPGPNGQLRLTARKLDTEHSTKLHPVLLQERRSPICAKEIVPVEIPFWPFGMRWEAGETLDLQICAVSKIVRPEFPDMLPAPNIGRGKIKIHFGKEYDSQLRMPIKKHSGDMSRTF